MPKVSILIPVCNVEKFLKQCLDSVVNQSLKDIEIICVNDGSKDGCPQILDEYTQKDSRIKVIHKKNSGYGDSLNIALDCSCGEYIGIVESDDFASLNMYEELYDVAKKFNVDVVKSNWYEYKGETNTDSIVERFQSIPQNTPISSLEYKDLFVIPALIASGLYKREFLKQNNIRFLTTPGASYQDTGFAAKTVMTADKIVYVNKCYYHYRTDNVNSSVKQVGKVFCICDEYKSINEHMEKYPKVKKALFQQKCANQFREYIWNLNRLDSSVDKKFLKVFSEDFKFYYNNNLLDEEFYARYPEWMIKLLVNNPKKFYKKMKLNQKHFISFKKEDKYQVLRVFGHSILKFNKRKRLNWYYEFFEKKELNKILNKNKGKQIFVMSPFIPYYSPMKQRFQHLAQQLAKKGILVFYCTDYFEDRYNEYGNWKNFKQLNENLYLTNCYKTINKTLKNAFFYYIPISWGYEAEDFIRSTQHNKIIYDHIDSFNVGANTEAAIELKKRHQIISPKSDIVLYSSKKLKEDFSNLVENDENMYFVPNGVDYEHFATETNSIPSQLANIINQNKQIIGYHGALTKTWIDFDLIDKLAKYRKDSSIVLVGSTYLEEDVKLLNDLLDDNSNVYYIAAVNYNELPKYTNCFDVSIIPFKHGEIALNTNPIKLFENMAMGIPTVVTRDLVECSGYNGVWVSQDDETFLRDVDNAIKIKDETSLKEVLNSYAKEMTWEKQAEKIILAMEKCKG